MNNIYFDNNKHIVSNSFYSIEYDISDYKGDVDKLSIPEEYSYYEYKGIYFTYFNSWSGVDIDKYTVHIKTHKNSNKYYYIIVENGKIVVDGEEDCDGEDVYETNKSYGQFILEKFDTIKEFVNEKWDDFLWCNDRNKIKLKAPTPPSNIYFDNNKPTQFLIELLDYIGLTLDDFKALSKEELQGIIAKLKKPLDVGRETKATPNARHNRDDLNKIFKGTIHTSFGFSDKGDLSRYFSLDAWTKKNLPELYKVSKKTLELQEDAEKISPFLFTSKADKGSKNAGLEGFPLGEAPASARSKPAEGRQNALGEPRQNTNPCAKPISLYTYLINLFTQPHDLVLDPYCGSGTTPIACVLTNRHYIGLELEKEYFDIAEARVRYWQEQKEWQENKTSKEEGTLI